MAKLNLEIDGKNVSIETNDFPEIASEVRDELRSEIESEVSEQHTNQIREEKKNLYNQINTLKTKNSSLANQVARLSTQQPQNPSAVESQQANDATANDGQGVQANNNAAKPNTPNQNGNANTQHVDNSELVNAIMNAVNDRLAPIVDMQMNTAKQAIAKQYGGQVIEELISGSTEEELKASYAKAHEAWKKYNPTGVSTPNGAAPNNGSSNPQPNSTPQPNAGQNNNGQDNNVSPVHQAQINAQHQAQSSPNTVRQFTVEDIENGARNSGGANQLSDNGGSSDPTVRVSPDANNGQASNAPTKSPKDMNHEEYATYRESLLKSAKPTFKG